MQCVLKLNNFVFHHPFPNSVQSLTSTHVEHPRDCQITCCASIRFRGGQWFAYKKVSTANMSDA